MAKRIKYIKNTASGKRAIAGAKAGKDFITNPDGSRSSIRTATVGVRLDGKRRTIIVPTVVKEGGEMKTLTVAQATKRALATGDYATAKTLGAAERRSKKFSKRLGKIARKKGER